MTAPTPRRWRHMRTKACSPRARRAYGSPKGLSRLGGRLRGGRREHRFEQTGEAGVEVVAPQRVQLRRADDPLRDDARLAEHAEVVRQRRLGDVEPEAAARAGLRGLR